MGNGTNYFAKSGLYGLTGLETFIGAALRGFTIGGWFMVDAAPTLEAGLISRDGVAGNRGYNLNWKNAGTVQFTISVDGTAFFVVTSVATTLSVWHFIVGRFIPSVETAIFVDGSKAVNDVSVPASCSVPTQDFEVGRYRNNDARVVTAKVRDVFICRAALSDALIEEIRTATVPA